MKNKKRLTKMIVEGCINPETGEILSENRIEEWSVPREEPDYVKLYFNAVLEYNCVSSANTPTMLALLKYMSYANVDASNGGQIITLNTYVRGLICDSLKIKPDTLRKNIQKLCDGKIIRRIASNTYQANPYLFGRGDWNSIKNLRASFDWINGFIVEETEHGEE